MNEYDEDEEPILTVGIFLGPKIAGVNVDPVNVDRGLTEASAVGYDDPASQMIIGLALNLHRRGEEDRAEKMLLEYGVDLTSIYRIRAAAVAHGGE